MRVVITSELSPTITNKNINYKEVLQKALEYGGVSAEALSDIELEAAEEAYQEGTWKTKYVTAKKWYAFATIKGKVSYKTGKVPNALDVNAYRFSLFYIET